MSFHDILSPGHEYPYNLYVNSITAITGGASSDSDTFSVAFTGTFSASSNVIAAREGNIVCLNFTGLGPTAGVTGYITSSTGMLGEFAPVSTKVFPYNVTSGGTGAIGLMIVQSDGLIQFTANADSDTFLPGSCGVAPGAISYNLLS